METDSLRSFENDEQVSYGTPLFLKRAPSSSPALSSSRSGTPPAQRPRQSAQAPSDPDTCRVYLAAKDVGSNAYGVIGADVWVLHGERFVHETLWVDAVFQHRHASEALDQILDASHPQYAVPVPQVPGAGLAGYFWSLNNNSVAATNPNTSTISRNSNHHQHSATHLIWRDLQAITSDPFQPPYRRMQVLQDAGFGKATGIPFQIGQHRGVVVYLTRATANEAQLNDPTNIDYLMMGTQFIASASAMVRPRLKVVEAKEQRLQQMSRRVRTKMNSVAAFRSLHRSVSMRSLRTLEHDNDDEEILPRHRLSRRLSWSSFKHGMVKSMRSSDSLHNLCETARLGLTDFTKTSHSTIATRFIALLEKSVNTTSSIKPPPAAPWENAVWTFVGAFMTLLVLFGLSLWFQHTTGTGIVLAPFGALLTLQFSLTPAPASQPRNVIYGQLLSLSLALLGRRYLYDVLPIYLLVPLVAALAIASMTKLGIPHPPAAAAVIALYAQPGGFDTYMAALIFVGNMVAVAMAILINNLPEKRQYPVYWEFGLIPTTMKMASWFGRSGSSDARNEPLLGPGLQPRKPRKYSSTNSESSTTIMMPNSFQQLSEEEGDSGSEGPIQV